MIPVLALSLGEPLVLQEGTISASEPVGGFDKPPWPEWGRADSLETLEPGTALREPNYGPVTYGLAEGWTVRDVRGQGAEIRKGDVGVGLPELNCRRPPMPVGVYADPPRVVLRCPDRETMGLIHSVLWAPDAWLTWEQRLKHNTLTNHQGLSHPVLPERGDNPEHPETGLPPALLDTYTRWVDLERQRLFTSEPMDVVHMSIRGIPETGLLRRLPEEALYWADFSAGTLRPVEGLPWCPGQLVERDREGSRLVLHCTSQPEPKLYRFTMEWGAVVDIEQGLVWLVEGTPERLVGDSVVLSERKSAAAEAHSEHGGLSLVHLGVP